VSKRKVLITGGAGFIGSNAARAFLSNGDDVVILDNLSRKGAKENLEWLRTQGDIVFERVDVRNAEAVARTVEKHNNSTAILHLAGQVAVTTSLIDPRTDFEINALGTFNVLEAVRTMGIKPLVLFSSTNKVYGGMEHIAVIEGEKRYEYRDYPNGIPEDTLLDFHSPYGCSKGAADQYVRDYGRVFGIPTVVMRQSCIYGPRQFGIEDQGWVAWFIIAAILKRPITIYGNGKQVRDILLVDDLVRAYQCAIDRKDEVAGRVFNIGGGTQNTLAVWTEFQPMLEELLGREIEVTYAGWRQGDQPIFVSDISRAKRELGWNPQNGPKAGLEKLFMWVRENEGVIRSVLM
jgi:CDP-paratose 2-epimerase